jgi:hypothetical protein
VGRCANRALAWLNFSIPLSFASSDLQHLLPSGVMPLSRNLLQSSPCFQ